MRVNKLLVPSCLSLIASASAFAAAPTYTIVDLGVLGTGTSSGALGISPGGVVAGRSYGTTSTAFSWTQAGGMQALPALTGSNFMTANGANDKGAEVGISSTNLFNSNALPVMWQNGQVQQLAMPTGYTTGIANAINGSNVAVGSVGSSSAQRAVVYSNGGAVLTPLLPSGGQMVTAYSINDSGWAVGYGTDPSSSQLRVGLVYDTLTNTSFSVGTLAGKNGAIAYGVSTSGEVVGSAMQNSGGAVPFYWTQGAGMQAIPLLAGQTLGTARSVNSSGWVVGTMGINTVIPFLYDGSSSYALSDLLPAGSGWAVSSSGGSSAMGISEGGVITGTALLNGVAHGYAMVPTSAVPEPGSYALMMAGLAAIGWGVRRRQKA